MVRRRRTEFDESASMNNKTYGQYLFRLTELSMSMFEWVNVPETVDIRFLELTLFGDGKAVFFNDETLGYLALKTTISGKPDVYNIPIKRRAYAVNGYQRNLDNTNSVIIYNNLIHTNSMLDVRQFAKRLYEIDRIIDVNVRAQKTPVLLQGTEQQRLTLLNLYQKYDGNAPMIFGDKNLDINGLKSLKTDAPYIADKLYALKTQIWNEALTYLGISNTNVQKKERMISDEVMRNMGGVIASRYSRLESRRTACKQINEMFGLDIEVNYREDYREADDELMIGSDSEDGVTKDMVVDTRTLTKKGGTGNE